MILIEQFKLILWNLLYIKIASNIDGATNLNRIFTLNSKLLGSTDLEHSI